LYESIVEIEQLKRREEWLTRLDPKKRWNEKGYQAKGFPHKKLTIMKLKPQGSVLTKKHCTKCG